MTSMPFNSSFRAPWWARSGHLQTLLPRWLRRHTPQVKNERWILTDGDFIDLAWSGAVPNDRAPLLVIFHGLEGSIHSHYAKGLMRHCQQQGLDAVLMHFRGCSGEPNRQLRSYHAAAIDDSQALFALLAQRLPNKPLFAVGFSLGGNMLVHLLAKACPVQLKAAVVVSAPLDLACCAKRLNQGFSKIYQQYLLTTLRAHVSQKIAQQALAKAYWPHLAVNKINTLRDFDEQVTAPLHGFADASDYYQQAQGLPLLNAIPIPTLFIHSRDDPFMTDAVIPAPSQLAPYVRYELSPQGGHVGFIYGSPWRPRFWLEERISQWLDEHRPSDFTCR